MNVPSVREVEPIPVADALAEPYGSARGLVAERTATLVKVTTSEGIIGWGECFGPPKAVVPLVEELGELLVGRSVDDMVPFAALSLQTGYHRTTGGLHVFALSGVDIALWDAWGRTLGISVGRLLGGRARESVTAYASTGYATPDLDLEVYSDSVAAAVEEGFSGAKVKIGMGLGKDRERAVAAREQLGPERHLMVDFNASYTADAARRSIEAISDLEVSWAEEPLPPEDLAGLRRLRELRVPLSGGEALCTRQGFREVVSERLLDIVQPDVCKCGGITEAHAIADLARTWNVRVSPHTWGTAIGQAATLQFMASVPDYPHTRHAPDPLWFEFDRGPNRLREDLLEEPFVLKGGEVTIPDGPGLGVEIDVDVVDALRINGRA